MNNTRISIQSGVSLLYSYSRRISSALQSPGAVSAGALLRQRYPHLRLESTPPGLNERTAPTSFFLCSCGVHVVSFVHCTRLHCTALVAAATARVSRGARAVRERLLRLERTRHSGHWRLRLVRSGAPRAPPSDSSLPFDSFG